MLYAELFSYAVLIFTAITASRFCSRKAFLFEIEKQRKQFIGKVG